MANLLRTMTPFVKPPGEVSTRHTENFMGHLDVLKKQSTSSYRSHAEMPSSDFQRQLLKEQDVVMHIPNRSTPGVERPRITEASEGGLY